MKTMLRSLSVLLIIALVLGLCPMALADGDESDTSSASDSVEISLPDPVEEAAPEEKPAAPEERPAEEPHSGKKASDNSEAAPADRPAADEPRDISAAVEEAPVEEESLFDMLLGENTDQPKSVKLSGPSVVYVGYPAQYTATLSPAGSTSQLTWAVEFAKYGSIDQDGVFTPTKVGKVRIRAMAANGKYGLKTLTIASPYKARSVKLDRSGTVWLTLGDTLTLNATMTPSTATSALKWATSDRKIATVSASGVVTTKKVGTATIKVTTSTGKTATVKVKVVDPRKATSVALDKTGTQELLLGETLQLTATMQPDTATGAIKWSSSNKKIATVSSNGLVTPKKDGTVTITATTTTKRKASVKVKVVDPRKAQEIIITPEGPLTLNIGDTIGLAAEILPDTAERTITWKSSASKYASVDENGVVTAKLPGTAKISAKGYGGKTSSVTVTVVDPYPPTSVTLEETGTVKLYLGEELQLHAGIVPEENLTALSYSISTAAKKYVSVSKTGLVKPKKAGTVTITVSAYNKKKATVKVRVVDPVREAANRKKAEKAFKYAYAQLGKPYKFGAPHDLSSKNPSSFDCSGLVCWAYKKAANIKLPHKASQIKDSKKLEIVFKKTRSNPYPKASELQTGDIILISSAGDGKINHCGICDANGQYLSILHACTSGIQETSLSYYYSLVYYVLRLK